jgi:hypothetical protein
MISGEGEITDQKSHGRSRSHIDDEQRQTQHRSVVGVLLNTSYPSQVFPTTTEKRGDPEFPFPEPPMPPMSRGPMMNPLKGMSLGIFAPESAVRTYLCRLLVHPWTEPFILILIVLQTVLLAVEAAPSVFDEGKGRPTRWGRTPIDWAMLGIFIIFTFEIIARIIVSGFILNAAEYSTIDRKRGIKAAVSDQYRAIFQPQRQKSVKAPRYGQAEPAAFARSFTIMQRQIGPQTVEDHQRWQLARRAFLRHGFNRLDFLAVVSFWISLVLGITGLESKHHIYIFKMLSCLRIIRLLALTNGTAVSAYLA